MPCFSGSLLNTGSLDSCCKKSIPREQKQAVAFGHPRLLWMGTSKSRFCRIFASLVSFLFFSFSSSEPYPSVATFPPLPISLVRYSTQLLESLILVVALLG